MMTSPISIIALVTIILCIVLWIMFNVDGD